MFGIAAPTLLWWSNEIRIWAAGIAAIAAFVTFVASYGQIRLQSIVSADKDRTQNEYRLAAEERIAMAQEHAARANEKAASLEKEAAEARLEQERLRSQVAWRQIPPELAGRLRSNLLKKPGSVTIAYVANDPEALAYSLQFARIFKEAGWAVRPESRTYSGRVIFGLVAPLQIGNINTPVLHSALADAGVSFSRDPLPQPEMFFAGPELPNNAILYVGSKRPPF